MKKQVKTKVVITMTKKEVSILFNILNTVNEHSSPIPGKTFTLHSDEKQFINEYLNLHINDIDIP